MTEKFYCIVDLSAPENETEVCFATDELKGLTIEQAEAWIAANPDLKYKIMRHNDLED